MDTIVFRTLGAWGAGKGANLTPTEVDSNFWSLAQAIVELQDAPADPVGIASITVAGTQMTITLTDGAVMGPFTLPVLTFRWRGEWTPMTLYAELDVFTVENTGIFLVQIDHTSGATFDAGLLVGGQPALLQLFGSTDASLSALPDVALTDLQDEDFLRWSEADGKWENIALGDMAYQAANAVAITGGTITGMPGPSVASDVATKGYVDGAVSGGPSILDNMILSNISGTTGPATAHTLSDYLDHALSTTVRGTLYYRGASAWVGLAPGSSGQFLKTFGAGADPQWAVAPGGVTNVATGTGLTGGPITGTGTVSFATIATGNVLANVSGATNPPTANTPSAILDATIGNTRGSVAYRGSTVWTALPPDSAGKYLKTQGPGVDPMWDNPAGSGSVTSVGSGAGLIGGPITSTGTISIAPIADSTFLANVSGSSATPSGQNLTEFLDHAFGSSAQGTVIYRGALAYAALGPGTSGQVLTTGGASANPIWASGAGGSAIANAYVLANLTGGSAVATGHSISDILDYTVSSARGTLLMRGAAGWVALAPGTAGQVLTTGGSAADAAWAAGGGAGISIGDTPPASPQVGQQWFDSVGGNTYLWFNDGTSTQWVPASNQPSTLALPLVISDAAPASPQVGQQWFDSIGAQTYLWFNDGTSSQWVPVNNPAVMTGALPLPVSIANGGTNATTATAALTNLGAVAKAGDTMTGALTIAGAAGTFRAIQGFTGGSPRWGISLGDNAAETGGNAGSNFGIGSFNDAGSSIATPVSINRQTSDVSFVAGTAFHSGWITAGAGYQTRSGIGGATQNNVFNIAWPGGGAHLWIDNVDQGLITVTCDYRIKDNITGLPSMWDRIKALRPISYTLKENKELLSRAMPDEHWGFIAHELQETLLPSAATGYKDAPNLIQSPDLMALIAPLTSALQEAMARIERLEAGLPPGLTPLPAE
jgi:hypothetical protein